MTSPQPPQEPFTPRPPQQNTPQQGVSPQNTSPQSASQQGMPQQNAPRKQPAPGNPHHMNHREPDFAYETFKCGHIIGLLMLGVLLCQLGSVSVVSSDEVTNRRPPGSLPPIRYLHHRVPASC